MDDSGMHQRNLRDDLQQAREALATLLNLLAINANDGVKDRVLAVLLHDRYAREYDSMCGRLDEQDERYRQEAERERLVQLGRTVESSLQDGGRIRALISKVRSAVARGCDSPPPRRRRSSRTRPSEDPFP